jgi:hypothetical protein
VTICSSTTHLPYKYPDQPEPTSETGHKHVTYELHKPITALVFHGYHDFSFR